MAVNVFSWKTHAAYQRETNFLNQSRLLGANTAYQRCAFHTEAPGIVRNAQAGDHVNRVDEQRTPTESLSHLCPYNKAERHKVWLSYQRSEKVIILDIGTSIYGKYVVYSLP